MKTPDVNEVRESRSVPQVNALLRTGWRLLEITPTGRGPIYSLGARTANDQLQRGDRRRIEQGTRG